MPKNTPLFHCTHCDAQYPKWSGRCLTCGKWGTIEQETNAATVQKGTAADVKQYSKAKTQSLKDIKSSDVKRMQTKISELDRVLGGGIVPGSFILLGGEPGIGKSTLSLQVASIVPDTLYVSGEESVAQIKMRADRILESMSNEKIKTKIKTGVDRLKLSNETNIESVIATIHAEKPRLAVIDSIQTIFSAEVDGEAGNIGQVRACATKLLACAKESGTTIILIGHVTKEGNVAGPRTLEHLVDTVLYLEGDRYQNLRILRAVKNRFGSTDEIGMFAMDEHGLSPVENPSALLLAERGDAMSGSVVTCLMEGTRPILVEVQALVSKTSFGYPVRKASGFDLNRLHVLIAVLQRRAGLDLGQYDVHVNIVGGVKANEPAADLAVCLAIASAFKDKTLGNDLVVFGEVGLGGEIRSVRFAERRVKEAAQFGLKRAVLKMPSKKLSVAGLKLIGVKHIQELLKV